MPIKIYTYPNPYQLEQLPYWEEIRHCPYFCIAQTLVNGLISLYPQELNRNYFSTVKRLTESMFDQWESASSQIQQHTEIDNIINLDMNPLSEQMTQESRNIAAAFRFNREEVYKSIRTMFELQILPEQIDVAQLTREQRYIVDLYSALNKTNSRSRFTIRDQEFAESEVNLAIQNALKSQNRDADLDGMDLSTVVLHGIHQFQPIMLRAIEELAKYKTVILLFNYQQQYSGVFQTWVDIYSFFEDKISFFYGDEFIPTPELEKSYEGNLLADLLGKLINGNCSGLLQRADWKILEFNNKTEFAGYVAQIYDRARQINSSHALANMAEQFYAADSSVNDILKVYFPEQYGERQFLNYPLGRFFVSLANMWDPVQSTVAVRDLNDIQECFGAGILYEERTGELTTIFEKTRSLFEGCTEIGEMLQRLKKIKKQKRRADDLEKTQLMHISYYALSSEDMLKLENALSELQKIGSYFYAEFESRPNNFSAFYQKLSEYLREEILDSHDLNQEFQDILTRVLARLDEVKDIEASASFECLKSTMSIYLRQQEKEFQNGARIVRDFAQAEGDVLRSTGSGNRCVYHFACLTDEDMTSSRERVFPWPLDEDFFVRAQQPVDWKYQVYVQSKTEYKNYKRYSLIYALEFNRNPYILSYIRNSDDREREPYFLLRALGIKPEKFRHQTAKRILTDCSDLQTTGKMQGGYEAIDYYRFKVCKYRFLLQSILSDSAVYRDSFLQNLYFEIVLENEVQTRLDGFHKSEIQLDEQLAESYEELSKFFPYVGSIDRIDTIKKVKQRVMKSSGKEFCKPDEDHMQIKAAFLHRKLVDNRGFDVFHGVFAPVSKKEIMQALNSETLQEMHFSKNPKSWCKYCADQAICLEYIRSE